jgi:uncharacterized membrane protein YfcA
MLDYLRKPDFLIGVLLSGFVFAILGTRINTLFTKLLNFCIEKYTESKTTQRTKHEQQISQTARYYLLAVSAADYPTMTAILTALARLKRDQDTAHILAAAYTILSMIGVILLAQTENLPIQIVSVWFALTFGTRAWEALTQSKYLNTVEETIVNLLNETVEEVKQAAAKSQTETPEATTEDPQNTP